MAWRSVGHRSFSIAHLHDQLDECRLAQIRQQEQLQKQSEQLQNPIAAKDIQQEKLDKVIRLVIRLVEQLQNQKEQLQGLHGRQQDLYKKFEEQVLCIGRDKLADHDKDESIKACMTSKTSTVKAMKATKAMKSQKSMKAMKKLAKHCKQRKTGTVKAMKATKAMKSQKAKKAMKAILIT